MISMYWHNYQFTTDPMPSDLLPDGLDRILDRDSEGGTGFITNVKQKDDVTVEKLLGLVAQLAKRGQYNAAYMYLTL